MDDLLFRNAWMAAPMSCACLRTMRGAGGEPYDMRITQVNEAFMDMAGGDGEELQGASIYDLFPYTSADENSIFEFLSHADGGGANRMKYYSEKSGSFYEVILFGGSADEYIAVIHLLYSRYPNAVNPIYPAITPQLNTQLFGAIVSSISDGIIAADENGLIIFINKIASDMVEWDVQTALGMHVSSVFSALNYKTRERRACPIIMTRTTKKPYTPENDSILISRLGLEKTITYTASPVFDGSGALTGFVLTFRDITLEKQKLEAIEFLSYHDILTGLYNRTFFEAELKRLDTQRNYPLTVVVADLNSLKLTNDAFGHAQGDCLLRKAGEVLKACCRADDIIARIGGDEFVILLPRTSSEDAGKIVERIKELCRQTEICSINLSISFGWEAKTYNGENIRDIQKRAENNMYRQKLFESSNVKGNTVKSIISALYGTQSRQEEHSKNVSRLCELMGKELGMSEPSLKILVTSSLMHDIGKIATDTEIEQKLDPLTEEDWVDIKRHPEIGYRILSSVKDMTEIAECVLSHHERWDGSGYPRGLSGEDIPLCSRIIAIADAYDAMTSNRTFRRNMSSDDALAEIKRNAGTQFDPKLAELFSEIYMKNNSVFSGYDKEAVIEKLLRI